jgi:hypothetical protein
MNGPLDVVNVLTVQLAAGVDLRATAIGVIGAKTYEAGIVTTRPVTLPPLALIHPLTQPTVDAFPAIEITPGPAGQVSEMQQVDGLFQWKMRYTPRLYSWVRGDDYDETNARALTLATAIKETILADLTLGTTVGTTWECALVPKSWAESDTLVRASESAERGIQGRWQQFAVDVTETAPAMIVSPFPLPTPIPAPPHTMEDTVVPLHPSLAEIGASS